LRFSFFIVCKCHPTKYPTCWGTTRNITGDRIIIDFSGSLYPFFGFLGLFGFLYPLLFPFFVSVIVSLVVVPESMDFTGVVYFLVSSKFWLIICLR